MEHETRPLEDWVQALGLTRRGSDYVGACPVCGGDDRFHCTESRSGRVLVGCRGCLDGQLGEARVNAFVAVLKATFPRELDEQRRLKPPPPLPPTYQSESTLMAHAITDASRHPSRSHGMMYLAMTRNLYPTYTDENAWRVPLPISLRWIDKDLMPGLPEECKGAMVYIFREVNEDEHDLGLVKAVQIEGIDKTGNKVVPRLRKTYGPAAGAVFGIDGPPQYESDMKYDKVPLILCEGPLTALAAHWRWPMAEVWATGGTSGYGRVPLPTGRPVIAVLDNDEAGARTGDVLMERREQEGLRLSIETPAFGSDLADTLHHALSEGKTTWMALIDRWKEVRGG